MRTRLRSMLDNLALHHHSEVPVSDRLDAVLVHPMFLRKDANDFEVASRIRDVQVRNNRHRLFGLEFVPPHCPAAFRTWAVTLTGTELHDAARKKGSVRNLFAR